MSKASLRGDRLAGTLMLGSVGTSGFSLLPPTISQMRVEHQAVKVNLRVGLSSQLIADVAGGGWIRSSLPNTRASLRPSAEPVSNRPLLIITPKGMPVADRVEMLNTQPFVRFRSTALLANLIDTEISRRGVATLDVAEIDTIDTIVTCVPAWPGDFRRAACCP